MIGELSEKGTKYVMTLCICVNNGNNIFWKTHEIENHQSLVNFYMYASRKHIMGKI